MLLCPGDLPESGIEPTSPALADIFFTTEPPGSPVYPLKDNTYEWPGEKKETYISWQTKNFYSDCFLLHKS